MASVRLGALVTGQTPRDQRLIREQFDRNLEAYAGGGMITLPVAVRLGVGLKPAT